MKTLLVRLALAMLQAVLLVGIFPQAARASGGRVLIRQPYTWPLSLDKDTKAVVGPIDAERSVKIRLDPVVTQQNFRSAPLTDAGEETGEQVRVCILEHYCQIAALPVNEIERSPEIDFSETIAKILEDNGQLGGQGLGRAFITLHREAPLSPQSLSLVVNVETDHTMELPQFSIVPELSIQGAGETPAIERDEMGVKTLDLNRVRVPVPGDSDAVESLR